MTTDFDPHPIADLILDGVVDARVFRLPPGRVWRALTDQDELARWLAPAVLVPEVGGPYRFDFGGDGAATGTVLRCDAPEVLELTWSEGATEPDSVVRFEISPHADGCMLTLGHHRLPPLTLPGRGTAWHTFLDVLGGHLDGTEEPSAAAAPRLPSRRGRDGGRRAREAAHGAGHACATRTRLGGALGPGRPGAVARRDGTARPDRRLGGRARLRFGPDGVGHGARGRARALRHLQLGKPRCAAVRGPLRDRILSGGTLLVLTHLFAQGTPHRMAAGWRCHLRELRQLLVGVTPWWDAQWFEAGLRAYSAPGLARRSRSSGQEETP